MNSASRPPTTNPYLSPREAQRQALLAVHAAAIKLSGRLRALPSRELDQALSDIATALGPEIVAGLAARMSRDGA